MHMAHNRVCIPAPGRSTPANLDCWQHRQAVGQEKNDNDVYTLVCLVYHCGKRKVDHCERGRNVRLIHPHLKKKAYPHRRPNCATFCGLNHGCRYAHCAKAAWLLLITAFAQALTTHCSWSRYTEYGARVNVKEWLAGNIAVQVRRTNTPVGDTTSGSSASTVMVSLWQTPPSNRTATL